MFQLGRQLLPASIVILALSVVGCSSTSTHAVTYSKSKFLAGETRLSCGFSCTGDWGSNLRTMKMMHEEHSWDSLAQLVTDIGFNQDLAYYYLGQSAEGVGSSKAALKYYELSLQTFSRCSKTLNVCNGVDLPAAAIDRVEAISARHGKTVADPALLVGQEKLANLGYYEGALDGIYGPKTKAAISHFQQDNGLVISGSIDATTLKKLYEVGPNTTGAQASAAPNNAPRQAVEKTLESDSMLVELPTIFARTIQEIKAGERVSVIGAEDGWLKIQYNGAIGYLAPEAE